MAELVLGLASSHSPQLSTLPEEWNLRGENDKRNPALIGTDGLVSNYEDLLARTNVANIAKEITLEKWPIQVLIPPHRSSLVAGSCW